MSFLEEGSGGSLTQENLDGRDSDGTTIPKLTLKLGDEKREGYGEEEKDVPDVDEGKEDGKDDETSGNEDKESEEDKSGGTTDSRYNEEQDLVSMKPDPGYSEIGVWDNKVGGGGSENARQNEQENIMEKLKEVL